VRACSFLPEALRFCVAKCSDACHWHMDISRQRRVVCRCLSVDVCQAAVAEWRETDLAEAQVLPDGHQEDRVCDANVVVRGKRRSLWPGQSERYRGSRGARILTVERFRAGPGRNAVSRPGAAQG
jgi:hypothetical protein